MALNEENPKNKNMNLDLSKIKPDPINPQEFVRTENGESVWIYSMKKCLHGTWGHGTWGKRDFAATWRLDGVSMDRISPNLVMHTPDKVEWRNEYSDGNSGDLWTSREIADTWASVNPWQRIYITKRTIKSNGKIIMELIEV